MAEQQNVQVQEQDINQLRKVRREKLAELQGNGKDPFVITKYDQDAHSQSITCTLMRSFCSSGQSAETAQSYMCPGSGTVVTRSE